MRRALLTLAALGLMAGSAAGLPEPGVIAAASSIQCWEDGSCRQVTTLLMYGRIGFDQPAISEYRKLSPVLRSYLGPIGSVRTASYAGRSLQLRGSAFALETFSAVLRNRSRGIFVTITSKFCDPRALCAKGPEAH